MNGQVIYYYPISDKKTLTHDLYNEAIKKVFDNPIAIDAFVDAKFQGETKINQFGVDSQYSVEVFVQYRDLVDKGIEVSIGDFFSFADVFYEITDSYTMKNIFGQADHPDGVTLHGKKARKEQFEAPIKGPTDQAYSDDDAIQKEFVQQRGEKENKNGVTGDIRDLQAVIDKPLTGPKEVSEKGALSDDSHHASSFYDEEST